MRPASICRGVGGHGKAPAETVASCPLLSVPGVGGPSVPVRIVNVEVNSPNTSVFDCSRTGLLQPTESGLPEKSTVGAPSALLHSVRKPWELGEKPNPVTVTSDPFRRPAAGLTMSVGGPAPAELKSTSRGGVCAGANGGPSAGKDHGEAARDGPDGTGFSGHMAGEVGIGSDGPATAANMGGGAGDEGAGTDHCGAVPPGDTTAGPVGAGSAVTTARTALTPASGAGLGNGAIATPDPAAETACPTAAATWAASWPGAEGAGAVGGTERIVGTGVDVGATLAIGGGVGNGIDLVPKPAEAVAVERARPSVAATWAASWPIAEGAGAVGGTERIVGTGVDDGATLTLVGLAGAVGLPHNDGGDPVAPAIVDPIAPTPEVPANAGAGMTSASATTTPLAPASDGIAHLP